MILLFAKEIQILLFDRDFAKSLGIKTRFIEAILFVLTVLAVVIGIRSVGVALMSAMLITPAITARQYTNNLDKLFVISGLIGVLSGFFGVYIANELSNYLLLVYPQSRLILPTGPLIVIFAAFVCFASLLFSPERGLLLRMIRIAHFRFNCICENVLKHFWRAGPNASVSLEHILRYQHFSSWYIRFILYRLVVNGWLRKIARHHYTLTTDGEQRAAKIVRLHRLWEAYLVDYCGVNAERVHYSAEEMEHILTKEIEMELIELLKDPKYDPHHQPIPVVEQI